MKPLLPVLFDTSQRCGLHSRGNFVQVMPRIFQVRRNLSRIACLDRIGDMIENPIRLLTCPVFLS
jgi:hypothetical protein